MNKHTPGPWEFKYDGDGDHAILQVSTGQGIAVTWGVPIGELEDQANARLMAASPDLLEALNRMLISFAGQDEELCMECGEKIGTGATCETCYVIGKAIAAIEKASGESTEGKNA